MNTSGGTKNFLWDDGDFQLTPTTLYSRLSDHPLADVTDSEVYEQGYKTSFRRNIFLLLFSVAIAAPWSMLIARDGWNEIPSRPWLSILSLLAVVNILILSIEILVQLWLKSTNKTMYTIVFHSPDGNRRTVSSTDHDQICALNIYINKLIGGYGMENESRYPHLDSNKKHHIQVWLD